MNRLATALSLGAMLSATATPRPIRAQAMPLAIAFLFDFSLSVTNQDVGSYDQFRMATEGVVQGLRRGDMLRFGIVANHLTLSAPLSLSEIAAFTRLVPVVPDADRFGPTPLWDQLDAAVTALAADTGRRSIVIVTDGRSTGNVHALAELVAHAKSANVTISAVAEDTLMRRPGTTMPLDPADTLKSLAAATGGAFEYDDGKGSRGGIKQLVTSIVVALRRTSK